MTTAIEVTCTGPTGREYQKWIDGTFVERTAAGYLAWRTRDGRMLTSLEKEDALSNRGGRDGTAVRLDGGDRDDLPAIAEIFGEEIATHMLKSIEAIEERDRKWAEEEAAFRAFAETELPY